MALPGGRPPPAQRLEQVGAGAQPARGMRFAQLELGFPVAQFGRLAVPVEAGRRVGGNPHAECVALAEQKHGAADALGGGGMKPADRFGTVRHAAFAGVETKSQGEHGRADIVASRLTPAFDGLGAVLGNAASKEMAAAQKIERARMALVGGASEQACRLGMVAGQAKAVIEQPAQHGFAGGAALFSAFCRPMHRLCVRLGDALADRRAPGQFRLRRDVAAFGHPFQLGQAHLPPEAVRRPQQLQPLNSATLDQAAFQHVAKHAEQRGGAQRHQGSRQYGGCRHVDSQISQDRPAGFPQKLWKSL